MPKGCAHEGCGKDHYAKGWCINHYMWWFRRGDVPYASPEHQPVAPLDRFMRYVEKAPGGCWLWTGHTDANGYGRFKAPDGRSVGAYRWAYETLVGGVPDGLHLDHLCRVRRCVNPAHLEPVTCRVNMMRGETFQAANARKTHCPQGHEYTPENTMWITNKPGYKGRRCRICARKRGRKRR